MLMDDDDLSPHALALRGFIALLQADPAAERIFTHLGLLARAPPRVSALGPSNGRESAS